MAKRTVRRPKRRAARTAKRLGYVQNLTARDWQLIRATAKRLADTDDHAGEWVETSDGDVMVVSYAGNGYVNAYRALVPQEFWPRPRARKVVRRRTSR